MWVRMWVCVGVCARVGACVRVRVYLYVITSLAFLCNNTSLSA